MIDAATPSQGPARFALAHDWLCGFRGGEAVLERLAVVAGELGEIDRLYTMFDDGRGLAPAIDALAREVSPLSSLPARLRRWLLPLYPWAVGRLSERLARRQREAPVDLLVSTSSAAIKGMRPPRGVPHVCYCHAPARYVWSVRGEYARGGGLGGRARGLGLAAAGPWYRRWDRASAAHVTAFVANSSHTAREIGRCFGREAAVVHPPVRTGFFTPAPVEREGFWLFAGALEPYKRVDLAIAGAAAAGAPLKIVGGGSMEGGLRRVRRAGVEVLGRVSDESLRDLYRRARLLVFPQIEDFGIAAVEAQACGCPVVARRAGGALDSVVEGETGVFFDAPEGASIARAADACPADARACRENAERFSVARFDGAMREQIVRALAARG